MTTELNLNRLQTLRRESRTHLCRCGGSYSCTGKWLAEEWDCTIGWLCPSSSRCKEVRGQLQRDRGRTFGTMCTCEETERGTHACKASKLGPVEQWWTQDGNLGITIQDHPPESRRRTHLLYFTYSYCILSCIWKLATSLLVLRYYEHLFLFSMLILHVTSSRFCLYLLNIYHFTYTFSHAHT